MWRRIIVALIALACLFLAAGLAVREILPGNVTAISWKMESEHFGGWSALDLFPDGVGFLAISDAGAFTRGRLVRENGRLVAVEAGEPEWLKSDLGPWIYPFVEDAEGVSLESDGTFLVSYEGFSRVWRHDPDTPLPEQLVRSDAFNRMNPNGSLEALASLPDGTILTIPEKPKSKSTYPVYTYDGQSWQQPYSLSRKTGWNAVGADFGPDGWLYLLEREFVGFGFRSSIRRFDISQAEEILDGEMLYQSLPGRHGNLEGIAIWRDDAARIRAVMVSDNNFRPFLRTQIVEAVLDEGKPGPYRNSALANSHQ
ncbi:esterase-like activity of phytase family protein [Aliiruegeria lutimaris]|uniref:Phytase-like domain-containing protein n=1 Tax=Aliiruegeria lutimaris TaxID=571298 RepID=A0A1G8Q8V8_9RHOB|nr:esterase-like activity of phytase family protein [Aliiruegeria lutimaris]SDJ00540.1 hypothetical protein SAMN04488026_101057 [Aliiruegeria lutimaris]